MRIWPLIVLAASAPLLLSQRAGKSAHPPEKPARNWTLTFADEFDGAKFDLKRWSPHAPFSDSGRGRELQVWAPDALEVSGGQLHISARRSDNRVPVGYDGANRQYVSGIVSTFGIYAQTYGKFEIRCRVPVGEGLRPGFALLPIPSGTLPAIDVFETTGGAPSKIFFANRWGTEQTERSYGNSFEVPDLSAAFHTISMEWDQEHIAWFVDGKEKFHSYDGVPRQPLYLVVDLAVNPPDASTVFPASFDIDYIRVYR